jgi:hypothetical protein
MNIICGPWYFTPKGTSSRGDEGFKHAVPSNNYCQSREIHN